MRALLSFTLCVVTAASLSLFACSKDGGEPGKAAVEQAEEKSKKTAGSAGEYMEETKKEFVERMEASLKDADAKASKIKEKAGTLADKTRSRAETDMAELSQKTADARRSLDKVRAASGEAWKKLKSGVESAIREVEATLKRVMSDEEE